MTPEDVLMIGTDQQGEPGVYTPVWDHQQVTGCLRVTWYE